jgi:hypothetical protein
LSDKIAASAVLVLPNFSLNDKTFILTRNPDTMASHVPSVSTLPASITSQDEEPPTITFTNLKELCHAVDHVSGDFLIVKSRYIPIYPCLWRFYTNYQTSLPLILRKSIAKNVADFAYVVTMSMGGF